MVEGDFIEDLLGNIFEVKGFHQPHDRIVCFIRYFPVGETEAQSRQKIDTMSGKTQNYQKIYDLNEKIRFIEKNYPEYIYTPTNYYFPLQAILLHAIKKHFHPEHFFSEIQNLSQNSRSKVQQDTMDFCTILAEKSQISLQNIGVTGSTLIGLDTPESDIDIIVYGFDQSLKIRETLRRINNNSIRETGIRPYTLEEFQQHYQFRVPTKAISYSKFLKYESHKLHQGKFRNRDYFIRFLQYEDRSSYAKRNQFVSRTIQKLGRVTLQGQVSNDQNWWTTPSILEISKVNILQQEHMTANFETILEKNHLALSDLARTFSLRGRYTENVRFLEHFEATGTVELVQYPHQSPFLQLALGSHPDDYLFLL